jgi:hypothetical protein
MSLLGQIMQCIIKDMNEERRGEERNLIGK